MSDLYVRGQFYTQLQLDRATNSSYLDYEKEILLPREEMEHVLTCVYTDIPGEISLPYEVILTYITPVNDVSDLVIGGPGNHFAPRCKLDHSIALIMVTFVTRVRDSSDNFSKKIA
eukprot:TRINITY_DN63005_c0_g1_i1.p1 TRINITY_DN63005_c0_g1~~TRINITY_DN63005_c0_g1_i1.p1  ORF type:complete len:125 (-),score=39.07 TRINITY_DN63005_c0_g1_i1:29-376(-)